MLVSIAARLDDDDRTWLLYLKRRSSISVNSRCLMQYRIQIVFLDPSEDSLPMIQLPKVYQSVDDAEQAGRSEILRTSRPPGSITYRVVDTDGEAVGEAGWACPESGTGN